MRNDVELLRIIAAFGVVWYHSGVPYSRDIAYAGLVVFLAFNSYFASISNKTHSVLYRAEQLLIPCLIWSVFYAALNFVRGLEIYPQHYSLLSKVLAAPAIHLWYLPFAFFCLIFVDKLKLLLKPVVLAWSSCCIASALLLSSSVWREWELIAPFSQYLHGLAALFFGLFFAQKIDRVHRLSLFFLLLLVVAYVTSLRIHDVSTTYAFGFAAVSILFLRRDLLKSIPYVSQLSKLMFGVYLLHPFVLLCMSFIGLQGLAVPVLGFVASCIVIFVVYHVLPRGLSKYLI
jgi:hypothetical protein